MAGDATYGSVVLLLHCDGANNSVAFPDLSPLARAVTVFGNAKVSTAQSVFGGASALFDGVGDYLSYAASADFQVWGGNCTIEFWAFFASSAGNQCLMETGSSSSNRASISLLNGSIIFYTEIAGGSGIRITAPAPSTNALHAIALVRNGTTITLYVDGIPVGTTSTAALPTGALALNIGSNRTTSAGVQDYAGHIDEVRITKGVARYTAAYSPAVAAFPSWAGQVTGIVRDSASAVAVRTVRAYRRDTGALVYSGASAAGTGVYTFNAPTLDELNVICMDDAAGTLENDLIARVIPA